MLDYIKGSVVELQPTRVVIDCNGVGYDVNLSLTTFSAIQGKESVKLYVYEQIREDAWTLYGFSSREEREMFLLLISVSGVGAGTARMLLSSMNPSELAATIGSENWSLLKNIKGIGPRTAQRIVVELKDKVGTALGGVVLGSAIEAATSTSAAAEEAVSALTMLGFAAPASRKVVSAIIKKNSGLRAEEIIKMALKELH
jgi:Holliday junction DNA helicase RuvA